MSAKHGSHCQVDLILHAVVTASIDTLTDTRCSGYFSSRLTLLEVPIDFGWDPLLSPGSFLLSKFEAHVALLLSFLGVVKSLAIL